jgi:CBS domain-containing protein
MKVTEVMTREVDPIDPSATVQEAATQMAELDVGAVLVGTAGSLEGILTDRDIILRVVVDGRNPAEIRVGDIMSEMLFTCSEDDSVEVVFAQMRERQIRRMPVLGASGETVGIVTLGDLAKSVESPEQITETLRDISEPHRSRKSADDDSNGGHHLASSGVVAAAG